MTKKKALGLSILIISLVWLFSVYSKPVLNQAFISSMPLNLEIADSESERIKGLSSREYLPQDSGLLFIFGSPGRYGIWMKDMFFPIDIAWLDENKKIIHLEQNVLPETYPEVFYPTDNSLYVLEVNAGFFEKNKIEIGQTLEMKDF